MSVQRTLVLSGLSMLVLASALCWLLTRSIAKPVRAMAAAMRRLAGGDTAIEIAQGGRKHEVGEMAAALIVFRDAALERQRLESETAAARAQADAARQEAAARTAELAAAQSEVVSRLGAGLARLSDSDLTARIEQRFAPDYEQLRTDFNGALAELQSAMQVIVANAAGLRAGAGEITHTADALAGRTEQQAASLEQTAASLDQITGAVRRTADSAQSATSRSPKRARTRSGQARSCTRRSPLWPKSNGPRIRSARSSA